MSPTYRDDRAALLASLDALRRENEDLRAENLSLRVLVDPAPSRASFAQMQGAFAALAVLLGAMVGAAALARESHANVTPRPLPSRDLPLAMIPLPAAPATLAPAVAPPPEAPAPLATPSPPSRDALRAALRPTEPLLARCLADTRGDLRLVLRVEADGAVSPQRIERRRGGALDPEAARCALEAAASLRLDTDAPTELRYTLRVDDRGLRVRRVRAR